MTLKKLGWIVIPALAVTLVASRDVQAGGNLVTNGDFTSYSGPVAQLNVAGGTTVTGWSSGMTSANIQGLNFLYTPGTADVAGEGSLYPYYNKQVYLWGSNNGGLDPITAPPNGSNFIAMDGDSPSAGALSQTIPTLLAGQTYTLTFSWAGAQFTDGTGATTEQYQVSLGGDTQYTTVAMNASKGFTGWMTSTMTFTPTTTGPATLSFFAIGMPAGIPPTALLADVSLTGVVPEPSSLVLVSIGTLSLFVVGLRRRARTVAI